MALEVGDLKPPQNGDERRKPRLSLWRTGLRLVCSALTLYVPNAAWSLASLVDRDGVAGLADVNKVAQALLLLHVLGAIRSSPIVAWPTIAGIVVLLIFAFRRNARQTPSLPDCPEVVHVERKVELLGERVADLNETLTKLKAKIESFQDEATDLT